jgi:hypothetical protein
MRCGCGPAAGGLAVWRMRRDRSGAEFRRKEVLERAHALEDEIQRSRQRLLAVRDNTATLQAKLAGKTTKSGTNESKNASKTTNGVQSAEEFAKMVKQWHEEKKTPEGQRRDLIWRTEAVAQSYEPLLQSLGFDADQAERFREIAFRRAEQEMDIIAVMQEHGLTLMDPSLGGVWNKVNDDYQNALRSLLGAEGYAKFREYERTVEVRDTVCVFIGATTLAGRPLTPQQAEELVQVFANSSPDYQKGGSARRLSLDWAAGVENARAVVSQEQLKIIASHEPPGGAGGLAWARFNQLLQRAREADRAAAKANSGEAPR